MKDSKQNRDLIPEEKRKDVLQGIIDFFDAERNEQIGIIAAENFLDHFLELFGKELYNQGVEDTRIFLRNRFADIDLDMDALLKSK